LYLQFNLQFGLHNKDISAQKHISTFLSLTPSPAQS